MKALWAVVVLLTFSFQTHGAQWSDSAAVAEHFQRAGVQGTFVLYDVAAETLTGYNRARAQRRFVPASTFKIPHSLIGLSVGAVASVDEVLPYGGHPQPFAAWERDMGLREAIALSNVAIYRALARRIGLARMSDHVARLDYGNARIGTAVDRFWLDGPLRISAIEQTRFLAELARGALPYPRDLQQRVRDIVRLERREGWALYGKTGWENAPDPGVGWWVGWVTKGDRVYAFALNMDVEQPADADRRLELGKASLEALGVL